MLASMFGNCACNSVEGSNDTYICKIAYFLCSFPMHIEKKWALNYTLSEELKKFYLIRKH